MTGIQPPSAQRILVTGASGFVGIGLLPELMKKGYLVRAAVRRNLGVCEEIHVGDIGRNTIWDEALDEVDIVIHLAGLISPERIRLATDVRDSRRWKFICSTKSLKIPIERGDSSFGWPIKCHNCLGLFEKR